MHLEIAKKDLQYLMNIVRVFRTKCKTKRTALCITFEEDCSEFVYSSEGFFIKYKYPYVAEFKGRYSIDLGFIKNILSLFDDNILELDFRDKLIVAHQNNTTLKGQVAGQPNCDTLIINEDELEEIPIEFKLSNKLLTLDLEEMGFENRDPYKHLYNVNKDKLIKMSSFCALFQTLDKVAEGEVTLTQDILSVCSVVNDNAHYFKYGNGFYIRDDNLEIKMPIANVRFPNLTPIIDKVKENSEQFFVKSADLLDICNKCCNLNLEKKTNRTDIVFKDGLMMYSYNGILSGSVESGLNIDYKMCFNPLLMRGILKYINEECIIICKNNKANTILIHNIDKTITFMLALCK